jgi:PAS domain S-box-containing protein
MISTFWDIPGMRSKNSLEFVAKLLEPIGIYDEQGQTVYASPTFLEILQAQTEEVDFFQYFSSEGIPRSVLVNQWQRALQGETILFAFSTGNAEEIECSLQFNSDLKLMFISARPCSLGTAYVCKITREYEQLLIALFNHPNLAMMLVSVDGLIVRCNHKAHELLGTQIGEKLYIESLVHPEDKLIDLELRQQLLNGELDSYTIEKRFVASNGEVIWINVSVSLIDRSIGTRSSQKYFIALLEDITENKKIYAALIRTEEKWKALVLNSLNLFIQTSSTGQILYISPAVERMLGYPSEALLGLPIVELIHPDDRATFCCGLQAWFSGLRSQRLGLECRWKTRSTGWVDLYIQGQRFPLGLEMDGIVITGYDITDRKQAELELRRSQAVNRAIVQALPDLINPI